MNKKIFRGFGAILLIILLMANTLPAYAIDDGVTSVVDEAYYGTTDFYGNLTEGGVVKSYRTNGIKTIFDYGNYDEVINLTDNTKPVNKNGGIEFKFQNQMPEHFYFEGKTKEPFNNLPWKLSVNYSLNGVKTKAEDLAGKTGMVDINVEAIPNTAAAEYARNNYVLLATAIFNDDNILSLKADGAQVQLVGNLRTVIFVALPGEEGHYTISVGTDDFSFGGMTFMMMPATLAQLDQISLLSSRKDDLEKNYELLSDSIDNLLNSVSKISGSLNMTADGLDQLNQARETISEGTAKIASDTDILQNDMTEISKVLSPITERTNELSNLVTSSTKTLDQIAAAVSDLEKDLSDLEDDLDDLSDTDSLYTLRQKVSGLESSLYTLNASAKILNSQTGSDSYEASLEKVLSLHGIYDTTDFGTFLASMLILSGKAADSSTAATMATQLVPLLSKTQEDATNAGVLENWTMVQGMKQLFDNRGTFEEFSYQLLVSEGVDSTTAAKTAKTMDEIWTIYSGTDADGARDRAALEILLTNLDQISEKLGYTKTLILSPTMSLISSTASLCDGLEDALYDVEDTNLEDSAIASIGDVRSLLKRINELEKLLKDYEPTLQKAISNVQSAAVIANTTINDLNLLIEDATNLYDDAKDDLDNGTDKALSGLADSLRQTAKSLETTTGIKTAKNNISSLIEDTWEEYTGDTNNLFLMDSTADIESLTDNRNPSPLSVQVLIRTAEINESVVKSEEETKEEINTTTFWQRVKQMFTDIYLTFKEDILDKVIGFFR